MDYKYQGNTMKLRLLLIICLLIVASGSIGARQEGTAGTKTQRPRVIVTDPAFSFGEVTPGTPLTHTFEIGNKGNANLEIKNVKPTCGCTTSAYDKVITPDQTGGITLTIKDTKAYKGLVSKNAIVETNDPDHPSFMLSLSANFKAE
jgi:hypothetical protein